MVGQQRLVGRHHVLAGGQRAQDEGPGRLEPADQLHHHLDLGIVQHLLGVGREREPGQVEALAGTDEIHVGDAGQDETTAGALLEQRALRLQELGDAGPDGAEAEQADANVAHVSGRGA